MCVLCTKSACRPRARKDNRGLSGRPGGVGREEHGGEFVGFSAGNAEAQQVGTKGLLAVMVAQGEDFDRRILQVLRVSEVVDEKKVALEAAGIGPAEQGSENSGVEIQAFAERPLVEFGGRTVEALAEE